MLLKILYINHIAGCVSQKQIFKRDYCTRYLLENDLGINAFKGREGHICAEEINNL